MASSQGFEIYELESFKLLKSEIVAPEGYFGHHISLSPNKNYLVEAFPEYDFSQGHEGLHGQEKLGKVLVTPNSKPKARFWINVPFANYNAVVSPDETELWTAGFKHSGALYVYGLPSGKLKKSISVEADPSELFFSKDGKYLAVACGETSFVSIIDTKTYEKIKDIKVDPYPANVWEGYDNTFFVQNFRQKSLNIIDLNTLKVTDYIDFPFQPGFMRYNNLTSEIWVCALSNPEIFIFRKSEKGKWEKSGNISFESPVSQFSFIENNSKALCVSENSEKLILLDTQNKNILKTTKTAGKPNGIVVWEK